VNRTTEFGKRWQSEASTPLWIHRSSLINLSAVAVTTSRDSAGALQNSAVRFTDSFNRLSSGYFHSSASTTVKAEAKADTQNK
jgi:hypothetical protein